MSPTVRSVDLVALMGPPGAGKSTLGNELNRLGIATYTDLEPMLVKRYGPGEKFAKQRPVIHGWIRDYYREQLTTTLAPVVMETTGIGDREFITELQAGYRLLLVKVDTSRKRCTSRVASRARGQHVTDPSHVATEHFFNYWHGDIAPTYQFGLTVTGTNLANDVRLIKNALEI